MPDQQPPTAITQLLARAHSGDSSALANVFPLIYDELRWLAQQQLRREPDGHTLSPTALVHEAYMRLIAYSRTEWTGRAHFMAVVATAMRRILVDHARGHRSAKRGGGMTEEETAEALGIGLRTAKRDWAKVKRWLHQEVGGGQEP